MIDENFQNEKILFTCMIVVFPAASNPNINIDGALFVFPIFFFFEKISILLLNITSYLIENLFKTCYQSRKMKNLFKLKIMFLDFFSRSFSKKKKKMNGDQKKNRMEILKKELNYWEKGFEIEFNRKPNREDIKIRPNISKYNQKKKTKKITKTSISSKSVSRFEEYLKLKSQTVKIKILTKKKKKMNPIF